MAEDFSDTELRVMASGYLRNDGTELKPRWTRMIEVAAHQAVNARFLARRRGRRVSRIGNG